jgi:hypothetical protein
LPSGDLHTQGLHGGDLKRAPQLVDDDGRQGFAVNVVCDDQ